MGNKIGLFIVVSLLVSCSQPSPCNEGEVRQHVIDSLHTIYTVLQGGYTPKQEPRQATVATPKLSPPTKTVTTSTDTTYTDTKGNTYPVHTGKNGGRYILRVSQKTGKEYKQYLK